MNERIPGRMAILGGFVFAVAGALAWVLGERVLVFVSQWLLVFEEIWTGTAIAVILGGMGLFYAKTRHASGPAPVKPWKALALPYELTRIKSMLSYEERQYLTWLTAEKYEGWGAIVDLGPWLGSSSAALAEGLKRRGRKDKITSFDLFRWDRIYMEPVARENLDDGVDFLPIFLREIGDYAAWIRPEKQDLMRYRWNGGPIEILFVDAAKTWELTNAIFNGFGEHLIPGRSRVVLQDFRHHYTDWLPLIFDSRPDIWREIESVEDGTTATFMPLKPLYGPGGIHTEYSESAFPLKSAEYLLRNRMARETPANRQLILRMLYRKYLLEGSPEQVRDVRTELLQDTSRPLPPDELRSIEDLSFTLVPQGWKAYQQGDYQTAKSLAERCFVRWDQGSVYAVALLGMSLLRMGDMNGARQCIDEVLTRHAGFLHAKLYGAELALAEGRYHEAEESALAVLRAAVADDEPTIEYALGLLCQVWEKEGQVDHAIKVLTNSGLYLGESPAYLTHLAQQQFKLGRKKDAMQNVDRALKLSPGHQVAAKLKDEWRGLGDLRP